MLLYIETEKEKVTLLYEDGKYHIKGDDEKYDYILAVEGTLPNAAASDRIIAISNTEYDFYSLALYALGLDSNDSLSDCKIILHQQFDK